MRLLRENLTDLTVDDLARIAAGTMTEMPSCVPYIACKISGEGCQSLLEPCYESTQCSHPC